MKRPACFCHNIIMMCAMPPTRLPVAIVIGFACSLLAAAAPSATRPSTAELLRPAAASSPPFDPTTAYDLHTIEGWPVRINQKLLKVQPDLAADTLDLLRFQLFQITRVVPAPALAKLRTVTLWVEQSDPLFPCMCYHASVGWVAGHGLNPEKAHGVELSNPRAFLNWTHDQPWMVLHELAHAYHDQFLPDGFDNAMVRAAYHAAREAKLYDAILRISGATERAYAMTNPMEYFSECSEAFFGTNDFYPFVRAELKVHDPKGYAMMREAWGFGPPATRP